VLTFEMNARGPLLTDPAIATRFDRPISAALVDISAFGQRVVVQGTPRGISSGGGGLRGSVFSELRGVPARREGVVASSLFYAPIVEVGRRPGKRPPLAPILLWVQRKLGLSGTEAQQAAFLITRKIGARGTVGAHMFERAFQRLQPYARQRFEALSRQLADLLGGR